MLPPMGRDLNSAMNNINSLLNHHQISSSSPPHFDPTSSHDDFLDQMLSSVPSSASSFPWENDVVNLDDKLRHHQISNGAAVKAALMLQHQQMMLSRGLNDVVDGSSFNSANTANDGSVKAALFNGFTGSLGQNSNQPQHFNHSQGGPVSAMNQPAVSGSSGGAAAQPRQRVRARRGQATDPHSIAERLRRERIAERMKALQELVPNANKTDKASMLDEIIDYVKFLQLQVKVLSMSRLGGAAAVAPLVGDRSAEARNGNGTLGASSSNNNNNDGMTVAENQVAKLMEEDMGSAMQYLQGKGLCLMPISLATAISTATCQTRNPLSNNPLLNGEVGAPTSPSLSALTVQSATVGLNGNGEPSVKDGNPV